MPQDYAEALDFNKTPIQYLAENYTKDEATRARAHMGGMKFTREEMTGKIGSPAVRAAFLHFGGTIISVSHW